MRLIIISILSILALQANAQLSIVQPSLEKPSEKVIFMGINNHFVLEGEGKIEKVTTSFGEISNQDEKSFDLVAQKFINTPAVVRVTYFNSLTNKSEVGVYSYKLRGIPTYPIFLDNKPSGSAISMKNLKNLEAKLHTEQFNIGLNPSIRSFDVQFVSASGKESSVVIVRGGKFKENKDFQKLANNAEVGGKILVRNAIIEIGEMTQEPLPLVYDIVK